MTFYVGNNKENVEPKAKKQGKCNLITRPCFSMKINILNVVNCNDTQF